MGEEVLGRVKDGKRYITVVQGGVPSAFYGAYDPKKKRIHLNKQENYKSDDAYMDTCIHEALHATFPSLSEHIITERTPILKRLLKCMGVRPEPLT